MILMLQLFLTLFLFLLSVCLFILLGSWLINKFGNEINYDDDLPANYALPCKHCNGKSKVLNASDQCSRAYLVVCEDCGFRTPEDYTLESAAVKEWNEL